jgi:TonB family protein
LTLGLLPKRKFNYSSLITAFVLQSALWAGLIHLGIIKPTTLIEPAISIVYMPLAKTVKSLPQAKVHILPKSSPVSQKARSGPESIPAPIQVAKEAPKGKPTQEVAVAAPVVQFTPNGLILPRETAARPSYAPPEVFGGNGTGNGSGNSTSSSGSAGTGKSGNTPLPEKVITSPVIVTAYVKPMYTEEARKYQITGEILLRVNFSASGKVHVIAVERGLGFGLDEQATLAAEKTQFQSALLNGVKVDTEATMHVTFDLANVTIRK